MILDPKRLSGFIREDQELREHLEENPSQTEQHNAWVERINGYFLEQGAKDYAVRLNDFSGMTFYGDGSDRSQISNSITGRCQRLQEFIAEIRSQSMTQPNQRDHGEPPGFVKNLMWLFRKRTWKEHPMPAAVALVIMISVALVAISQIINKELPDESPETELLKEYLKPASLEMRRLVTQLAFESATAKARRWTSADPLSYIKHFASLEVREVAGTPPGAFGMVEVLIGITIRPSIFSNSPVLLTIRGVVGS